MHVTHVLFVHEGRFRSEPGKQADAAIEVLPHQMTVEYHDYEADVGMMPWLTNPHGAEQVHRDSDIAPNITSVKYHGSDPSGMGFNSLITSAGAYAPRVYACSCKFPIPRLMLKALRPAAHAYTWMVNHQDIQILCRPAAKVWKAPIMHQHNMCGDLRWKKSFNRCAMISL